MPSPNVRQNRILLGIISTVMLTAALIASARLIASHHDAPLLMSVLDTNPRSFVLPNQSPVDSAPKTDAIDIEQPGYEIEPISFIHEQGDAVAMGWFNGRPVRPAGTMRMLVTAYSPDARSCGDQADGITASGYSVWTNGMKLVAADTKVLPFGSLVSVPGYGEEGEIVPVLDRGGVIKGHRLDVLYATHERARKWGAQRLDVIIWEYADGKPSDFKTQH